MNELLAQYPYQIESIATYITSRNIEVTEENFKEILKGWLHTQQSFTKNVDVEILSSSLRAMA